MSNSTLAKYKNISPNKNSPRTHSIDTITIHCMVAQWTAKQACDYFANKHTQASCNYAVGYDGSIGLCVEEKDRSWCSSSYSNDHRAITIEVASDTSEPYRVTAKAYAALIDLVTDICRRNGIKKLVWSNSKSDRINHKNGCNMTVHRDFANKSCPGTYLYKRQGKIAKEVNKRLSKAPTSSKKNTATKKGTSSFLPSRGYFTEGDVSPNVGKIAKFMRKTFPSYTSKKALGNTYGPNLIAAVKEFQERTGLEVDGNFGPLTLAELRKYGFKK